MTRGRIRAELALAERTCELTTAHPLRTLTDPVEFKPFHELRTPHFYLNCTEDIAMPPGEYARSVRRRNCGSQGNAPLGSECMI